MLLVQDQALKVSVRRKCICVWYVVCKLHMFIHISFSHYLSLYIIVNYLTENLILIWNT